MYRLLGALGIALFGGAAALSAAGGETAIVFGGDQLTVDLGQADWDYLAEKPQWSALAGFGRSAADMDRDAERAKAEAEVVSRAEGWKPIRVGRRWESMGHPELNDHVTWLRLKVRVPESLKGSRFGFFCTAVDDTADFYLNGKHVCRKAYSWGARIPEPVQVDLTSLVRFDAENVLMVRVNDSAQARGGGLLGHVLLYRSVPFERSALGGLVLPEDARGPFSVVLHLGAALLAKGQQCAFSASELRAMQIPPYILRDDELVLVGPADAVSRVAGAYRVQLDAVSPTRDDRPLSVSCEEAPAACGLYERMTLPIELSGAYDNPFDPRQINVQAVVQTPSGKTEKVPAFFWQDFTSVAMGEQEEILLPKTCSPWRLYYRPRETGEHTFHLLAQDKSGVRRTKSRKFTVSETRLRGFLRVSKRDPRFFEFDNGDSYFGVGPSGWLRDDNYIFGGNPRHVSTRRLDDYYRQKAEAGSNFDYCLAEFFGRLYTKGGFIDQHVAWKCEHRLRTLETLGIYWVTCYDDLCRSTVYGLHTLPYSAAQGGPCNSVEELYVNERALQMQRDHLRYFVGRMSDSPALLVWAIGDEGQAGSSFSGLMVRSWIKDLQNYVRAIDVYQHPHVMCEGPRSIADGGDAIIIPDWYFRRDTDAVSLCQELEKQYGSFNCPLINPEGGMVEWTKPDDAYGPKHALYYLTDERWTFPEAISFHNHLWVSLFLKRAVGGTEWMGAFIVKKNEMYHAAAVRSYLEGESLTKQRWEIDTPVTSHPDLRGFVLRTEGKSLVWVQNRFYTWLEAGHRGHVPPTIEGAQVKVPVAKEGRYRIEQWDTRKGAVVATAEARSESKAVTVALPAVQKDVAFKVVLAE